MFVGPAPGYTLLRGGPVGEKAKVKKPSAATWCTVYGERSSMRSRSDHAVALARRNSHIIINK